MKPQIDKRWVAASFSKAANQYDAVAALQRDIAQLTLAQACTESVAVQHVADIGCGTGYSTQLLANTLQPVSICAIDIAEGMLAACAKRELPNTRYICADAEALPVLETPFDLVFSNFALQWCPSIEKAFANVLANLSAKGRFAFSIPGAGSLQELKSSWAAVDQATHVNEFYSPEEIRTALINAGFKQIEIHQVERVLHYPGAMDLMRELKSLGAHNVHAGRSTGLTGKEHLKQMLNAYEPYRQTQGIPATWQVLIVIATP